MGENEDHAWFASYAPADVPELAVVVLIENVGFGGTHAAPVARKIFKAYYQKTRGTLDEVHEPVAKASAVKEAERR